MKQTTALFLSRVVASLVAMGLSLLALGAFIFWITHRVDVDAVERQREIAELAISEIQFDISHNQESSTYWDEAVVQAKRADSADWLDENLGTWMHTFYGMDELYVLDATDAATYAFADGERQEPQAFARRAEVLRPFLAQLRTDIADGTAPPEGNGRQSIDVASFLYIDGRPAIASVKPILSDSGTLVQTPETTFVHVAIQYLDGPFMTKLARSYVLEKLAVVPAEQQPAGTVGITIAGHYGAPPVAFVWVPFMPGERLALSISPILALVALLLMAGTLLLSSVSYRRKVDQIETEARIRYLATHDGLTGLHNRAAYEAEAGRLIDGLEERPTEMQTAFLFMDLDRFKQVNDIFGHHAGDVVLTEFARRAEQVIPPGSHLFRVGGDEFTVLAPRCAADDLEVLCRRLIDCLAEPIALGDRKAHIGVSIGVSLAPRHGTDWHELNRKADVALYHAKAAGRGCHSVFGSQMDDSIQSRAALEDALREALTDKRQLAVYYQPTFACGNRAIHGVEALVRWEHPENGSISPAVFVPIAETAGLIAELGLWVLERACTDARPWPISHVAVNVSPRQLKDPAFAAAVSAVLARTGFPAARLELEITETALAGPGTAVAANIKALSALGIAIAIDDFGTGSSTFERLKEIEFDRIKIDQSFVRSIRESKGDAEIVRAMIALAHAKGLVTTAEGVETAEQRDALCALGCDELQGYLLGRPMPAERITALVETA